MTGKLTAYSLLQTPVSGVQSDEGHITFRLHSSYSKYRRSDTLNMRRLTGVLQGNEIMNSRYSGCLIKLCINWASQHFYIVYKYMNSWSVGLKPCFAQYRNSWSAASRRLKLNLSKWNHIFVRRAFIIEYGKFRNVIEDAGVVRLTPISTF